MKKIYRILVKYINFVIIKILSSFLNKFGYHIIPNLSGLNKFEFDYSKKTRRLVFNEPSNRFGKIFIDTSLFKSKLCEWGKIYETNKSPYNISGHRSGFTGVYFLIFSQLKDKDITFAEIGIENNGSIKMFRDFFAKAEIHCFDINDEKLQKAKNDKLEKTFYHKIDVTNEKNTFDVFNNLNKQFDIIIDDSTHIFDDQIRIIKNCKNFLKNNGVLIIEDIFKYNKQYSEKMYYQNLNDIKAEFDEIFFLETPHINNYTASWKNEKMLVLIKK